MYAQQLSTPSDTGTQCYYQPPGRCLGGSLAPQVSSAHISTCQALTSSNTIKTGWQQQQWQLYLGRRPTHPCRDPDTNCQIVGWLDCNSIADVPENG